MSRASDRWRLGSSSGSRKCVSNFGLKLYVPRRILFCGRDPSLPHELVVPDPPQTTRRFSAAVLGVTLLHIMWCCRLYHGRTRQAEHLWCSYVSRGPGCSSRCLRHARRVAGTASPASAAPSPPSPPHTRRPGGGLLRALATPVPFLCALRLGELART